MISSNLLSFSFEVLRSWFLNQSLPLWMHHGVDYKAGGFFEKLYPNLKPTLEPRRTRLVARQIYWFAVGGALGWQGPVNDLIDHGFQFLSRHLIGSNGIVHASCAASGELLDSRQHLYDVAFVLLALAKQAESFSDSQEPEALARRIVLRLKPHLHGGYIDAITPDLQCANPHMHLFEAFLAWASLPRSRDDFWEQRAAALADLAVKRMIQPQFGALPEYFDQNWRPVPKGGIHRIEPGHQFEWSWLLDCWAKISGDTNVAVAASRLCYLAEQYGVDRERNVVIECINEQMLPCDQTARLWQQTERLKAWHRQTNTEGFSVANTNRDKALESLLRFISGPYPGLWYDEMDQFGSFILQPVKASSGYHIACAIDELFNRFSCN